VGVDIAREVETEFDGRADFCFDDDGSHEFHEEFGAIEGTLALGCVDKLTGCLMARSLKLSVETKVISMDRAVAVGWGKP
jgi:hypothetical protein